MNVRARFAPSPTGFLHVGNTRTALITWLSARAAGGWFLLRIDDTDQERSEERYVDGIRREMAWLGLHADQEARQSERMDLYDAAIERLKRDGRLYACYETPEELGLKRKAQITAGRPPIYDRAALRLTEGEKAALEAEGRRPHWRFKLNHAPITWTDRVRGEVRFEGGDMSDPVVIREDGRPLYHLCSVVDDIEFGITEVVRGEDHVTNTAAHIQMMEALGAVAPAYAHLPLLTDSEGAGLSKRLGSMTMASLRDERGLEPSAVTSYLARLGTSDPIEPLDGLQPLIDGFDFGHFGRAAPKVDPAEMERLNHRLLQDVDYAVAQPRLAALDADLGEAFWETIRPNLNRFGEVADWMATIRGPVTPFAADEDKEFLSTACSLLPEGDWDGETWKRWTGAAKSATGRKGKGLFMPLRRALTGMDHGPELAPLLPLIGRDAVKQRLDAAALDE